MNKYKQTRAPKKLRLAQKRMPLSYISVFYILTFTLFATQNTQTTSPKASYAALTNTQYQQNIKTGHAAQQKKLLKTKGTKSIYMKYMLPPLPYKYDALEPYIDARTMEIHHTKHHQSYVHNLNKALEKYPAIANRPLSELLQTLETVPADIREAVRNQGGGHSNHSFFWQIMKKDGGGEPQGKVGKEIVKTFGSFDAFKKQFNATAQKVFGSGWAWLAVDRNGKLVIISTENQDSPLSFGLFPILGLDVWEHAYYLNYQNKRPDYITAWWNVINWDQVEKNYRSLVE